MRQLLKKGTKWEWTTNRNSDLEKIKQELTTLPCLAHYNGSNEIIVTTDACKTGLGVALWQKQGNGELKPIAYASRYLNDAEKKYSIGERRTRTTNRCLGLRKIPIPPTRKTSPTILGPPGTRTPSKMK